MNKFTCWEKEIQREDILSVQINLLNQCTSKCKSCRKYTWPKDELAFEDVRKILKVLKEKFGLSTVVFSGGDPILYKDFEKVIELCDELDIQYSLITTLISKNEELIKKIARTAYRIHVSIDSVLSDNYKTIRGVNGLPIVRDNLNIIQEVRNKSAIPVRISSTISKMNYNEVFSLYLLAKTKGCLINYYFLHTWDGLKMSEDEKEMFYHTLEKVALDEQKQKKVITNAKQLLLTKYDFEPESKHCKRCLLPVINATINANGDIYPCCRLLNDNGEYGLQVKHAYGNVVGKSEKEIEKEFEKRLNLIYPQANTLCDECADRYMGMLEEIEKIHMNNKSPLFL